MSLLLTDTTIDKHMEKSLSTKMRLGLMIMKRMRMRGIVGEYTTWVALLLYWLFSFTKKLVSCFWRAHEE
jgi:hypothetical protein